MKTAIKISISLFVMIVVLSSFSNFTKGNDATTLKFEFTTDEVNLIFEGLGELPAKKSEGLRVKIYQSAQEQLKAQEQSVPKKN
jgi:hypothetical protein